MPMHDFSLRRFASKRRKPLLIPSENITNYKAFIRKVLKCDFSSGVSAQSAST